MLSPLEVTRFLSNTFQNVPVGKMAQSVEISPQLGSYSGVEIIVGEDEAIFSGDRTGRVLQFENKWGTQEQADNILSSLQGFQYQPLLATNAYIDPAAEVGDGVTVNGVYSGIYKMSKKFGSLMAADIEAPQSEAIDHEYPFEPKQDRVYRREIANAQAQIRINHDSIEAEVIRASQAEGTLSSQISQTATGIRADVVSKTGGSSSSFGWNLTDSSWTLTSNNTEVLKATSSGIEIKGKVTATSGYIGNGSSGFTITASSLYNGMNNLSSTANGVYIGTDGISVGGGKFRVTSTGAVSAANMTLTGTLTIGGSTITAAQLQSGALSAYNNGSYWGGGAGYGYSYNNATKSVNGVYPQYFRAINLVGDYLSTTHTFVCPSIQMNGDLVSWKSRYVITGISPTTTNMWGYLTQTGSTRYLISYVSNVSYSGTTIYYLGR